MGEGVCVYSMQQPSERKRKLPEWMSEPHGKQEEEEERPPSAAENAARAVAILEDGLMRAYVERQEALLLPPDDNSDPDDEAFDLSQSSVADVMTTAEALEIMGAAEAKAYAFKDDRKRLIADLKGCLAAEAAK